MNSRTSIHCVSPTLKENIPPSSKPDGFQGQKKGRTVLGVLSDNEQRGSSLSQGGQLSKPSFGSDTSQLNFFSCASSSGFDLYEEEVLADSGQEILDLYEEEAHEVILVDSGQDVSEAGTLEDKHMRLLLELSPSSCQDVSLQSEDEPQEPMDVLCVDYIEDIHQNLIESEKKFWVKHSYLERHPEITGGMRLILVDWLVQVSQAYRLSSETLHLAINYLDRFLSNTMDMRRDKLQLLGTAALLIAAKYEELSHPKMNKFVYITDSNYTLKELVQMEFIFLRVLAFNMSAPTINQFLHLFISVQSVCANTENLALYLAELSLLDIDLFLQFRPSMVAATAYCLAAYIVHQSLWPDSLRAFSGYTMADIRPCLTSLYQLYVNAEDCPQQAIRDKYKSSRYGRVSTISPLHCESLLHPPTLQPTGAHHLCGDT